MKIIVGRSIVGFIVCILALWLGAPSWAAFLGAMIVSVQVIPGRPL